MMLPVSDETSQQIRTPQQRTVGWCCAADRNVISSAGSRVLAIEVELFCSEPAEASLFEQRIIVIHQFLPAFGWMNVYLQYSRVRSQR